MARSQTKLSVIVPAFNEAETIALVLERVTALDLDTEIIVVDDSSTDRTLDAITDADVPRVRVVRHPVNQGKGAAVRTGLAEANGDVIVIQDADLEYHPNDFVPMLKLIEAGEARVVYGYRDFSSQRFLLLSPFPVVLCYRLCLPGGTANRSDWVMTPDLSLTSVLHAAGFPNNRDLDLTREHKVLFYLPCYIAGQGRRLDVVHVFRLDHHPHFPTGLDGEGALHATEAGGDLLQFPEPFHV